MTPGSPQPSPAEQGGLRNGQSLVPFVIPDHTLLQQIGRGSYGEVWLARSVMGTLRAVKIVYRRAFDHDRPYEREFMGIQRFEPISRTHEGLVDILQVGRNDEGGYFYYVMEVADDVSAEGGARNAEQTTTLPVVPRSYLPRTLAHEISTRGALPVDECLGLALSLASAVAHLHKHGLIHRDIKPANIIFVGGQPKLADIGLVSEVGDSRSYVGTEGYIPPEGPGTRQADLYSLGKLIYEASTGRDRTEFPALPVELTRGESGKRFLELNAVFVRACAQEPQQRYQSGEELQADLALLRGGKSVRHLRTVERRLALMTRMGAFGVLTTALALSAYGFAKRQARLDRENLLRIERAEKEAKRQLWESLVAQARASRRTGEGGQRFHSLDALKKAAALDAAPAPDTRARGELRNEAIAALALVDIRPAPLPFAATKAKVSVDADFERYAVADAHGGVQVRLVRDDQLLHELPPQTHAVRWVHYFSPDGQLLPVLYQDGVLRLWHLTRREVLLNVRPEDQLNSLDFSADGKALLVVDAKQTALRYELPSGKVVRQESPNVKWLRLRFSPDGRRIGGCSETRTMAQLVDADNGEVLAELPHPGGVHALAWAPDGQQVATACDDGNVYLWKPPRREPVLTLSGHQSAAVQVAFHPGGRLLCSSSWDGTVRLWDTANGESLVSIEAHGYFIRFSRDGRRLTSCREDGDRALWVFDLAAEPVFRFLGGAAFRHQDSAAAPGPQHSVGFSPDGRWLVSSHPDGVRVWETASDRAVKHLRCGDTPSAFFHPIGQTLVASSADGVLRWPFEAMLNNMGTNSPPAQRVSLQTDCKRAWLAVNGGELAYIHGQKIHFLRSRRQFDGPPGLDCLALSPDGRWLAASAWFGGGGRLWDLLTGRQVRDFAPGASPRVGFSPDSRWLVTAEREAYRFWDPETGRPGRNVPRTGPTGVGVPPAFSSDGRMLAVARSRTLVQLLNAETLEELACLEAPRSQKISWLAFDGAGKQLAVGTSTAFIQLWNLHLLRRELADLGLDWDEPPAPVSAAPVRVVPFSEGILGIPPRESATPLNLLDLSAFYDAPLTAVWDDANNLAALTAGRRTLGGVEYDVRGVIRLRGQPAAWLPQKVESIPVRQRCRRLHFLHTTAWYESEGKQIGSYLIHFEDGQRAEVPIRYDRDVRNWWLTPQQYPASVPAVWIGTNAVAARNGYQLHLFHSVWENPRPEVAIRHLDFVSANTQCPPVLLAVTAE